MQQGQVKLKELTLACIYRKLGLSQSVRNARSAHYWWPPNEVHLRKKKKKGI